MIDLEHSSIPAFQHSAFPRHLYLHVPYCVAKCPYCDFNSIAGREDEHARYVAALLAEVRRLPSGPYDTVFIGGGTPTFLGPRLLEELLAGVRAHIALADGYEWTCEANPGSSDAERFAVLAAHGVNRLSLGVQSTNDRLLKLLGRVHDRDQAERAVAMALAAVPRVSCDLIFAVPGQTVADLTADLDFVRRHGLRHASLYHLAFEAGTEFRAKLDRGVMHEVGEDESRERWLQVQDGLLALGLLPYETSNFAAPGHECRHNLGYWRQRDYHAAGAGAVSTVAGERTTREPHAERYLTAIGSGGDAIWKREVLTPLERQREAWMLGLRLADGVAESTLASLDDPPSRWSATATQLADLGHLVLGDGRIRLTAAGRLVQDAVTVALMP